MTPRLTKQEEATLLGLAAGGGYGAAQTLQSIERLGLACRRQNGDYDLTHSGIRLARDIAAAEGGE